MTDHQTPLIVDCACGLRYWRTAVATLRPQAGHARCACGGVIGAWSGSYRFRFEPEDGAHPPLYPLE